MVDNFDCSGHLCFVGSKTQAQAQAQAQVPEITFAICSKHIVTFTVIAHGTPMVNTVTHIQVMNK